MRLPVWFAFILLLPLAACDSNDDGLSPCDFTMEFSGALDGSVSGVAAFVAGDEGASQPSGLDLWLTASPEDDDVLHASGEGTCRVASHPPGGLFASRLYVRFDHPVRTGRYRTDADDGTLVVAYLNAEGCPVDIEPTAEGTLTLDRVTEDRVEGGFVAPLTVIHHGTTERDTLEATVTTRFRAWPLDSTIAECYNH